MALHFNDYNVIAIKFCETCCRSLNIYSYLLKKVGQIDLNKWHALTARWNDNCVNGLTKQCSISGSGTSFQTPFYGTISGRVVPGVGLRA
jgi:hypothetical protein